MTRGFFITGTDTGVGKSVVAAGVMEYLKSKGLSVVGMKPVASGAHQTKDGLHNEDAELLLETASIKPDYSLINPYIFEPAIAPHLAAEQAGQTITLEKIKTAFIDLSQQADSIVVEGVGGWQVPLNNEHTMADLVKEQELPVILVVGLKLGCINAWI